MKIALIIFLICSTITSASAEEKLSTNEMMGKVLDSFVKLSPLLHSRNYFMDKKSKEKLTLEFTNLEYYFKKAHSMTLLKSPAFLPSVGLMKDHLRETIDALTLGSSTNYVVKMARSTTQICFSCHSALEEKKSLNINRAFGKISKAQFSDKVDYADFMYLTRNFDLSTKAYLEELNLWFSNKGLINNKLIFYLEDVLKKIVITYTLASFEPKKLKGILLKYKNDERVPHYLKDQLSIWLESLIKAETNTDLITKITSDDIAKKFIEKNLANQDWDEFNFDMGLLVAVGKLKRYMSKNWETKVVPQIYYYQAKLEQAIGGDVYFSLSDLYLKQCIKSYSKHPFAMKCYDEYESQVTFGFTGTSGTNIPADKQKELKSLKSLIYKK